MATLLKPENKQTLVNVLTYHVVPGRLTTKDLREQINAGGGKTALKTVQGGTLTIEEKNGKFWAMPRVRPPKSPSATCCSPTVLSRSSIPCCYPADSLVTEYNAWRERPLPSGRGRSTAAKVIE